MVAGFGPLALMMRMLVRIQALTRDAGLERVRSAFDPPVLSPGGRALLGFQRLGGGLVTMQGG